MSDILMHYLKCSIHLSTSQYMLLAVSLIELSICIVHFQVCCTLLQYCTWYQIDTHTFWPFRLLFVHPQVLPEVLPLSPPPFFFFFFLFFFLLLFLLLFWSFFWPGKLLVQHLITVNYINLESTVSCYAVLKLCSTIQGSPQKSKTSIKMQTDKQTSSACVCHRSHSLIACNSQSFFQSSTVSE